MKRKSRMNEKRKCVVCGARFIATREWHRYCSGICRKYAFDDRVKEKLKTLEVMLAERA